jgi:hypothetical protein
MSYDRGRAGNIVSEFFFLVVAILFQGFVIMVTWGWFISPTFNVQELNFKQSIGLGIFISLFAFQIIPSSTDQLDSGEYKFAMRVAYYLTLIVMLGLGWIVHLFM